MIDFRLSGTGAGLFTDLYELTMAQAYLAEDMLEAATFSLYFRSLPAGRNFVLACGSEDVAEFLERMHFDDDDIAYLRAQGRFSEAFLDYLASFRFSGDVRAVPDGTPVFPDEPLVEVTAPAPEAQIAETWVLNQMHGQCVLASKAARVVEAAAGRAVLDFGLRRIHGAEAGLKAARAFHVAGVTATSNVLAGRVYGVPISGTMAHSYVQAHDSEPAAFRAFADAFPETVLLVDTYDTLQGVRNVVDLARRLGSRFRVRGVRLDSGDLDTLSRATRRVLDEAGLAELSIYASGGIDETDIRSLVAAGAPIDGFGVGTAMAVAADAPYLDMAYKLVEYAGEGRMKLSPGKETSPGRKQIFRQQHAGTACGDVLARRDEQLPGTPLLVPFVSRGARTRAPEPVDVPRRRAREALAALPANVRGLDPPAQPYPVTPSDALRRYSDRVRRRVEAASAAR
ncbi:MAG: nicotinate phosphoribosyltransferase [Pseudomonadota bacterium]